MKYIFSIYYQTLPYKVKSTTIMEFWVTSCESECITDHAWFCCYLERTLPGKDKQKVQFRNYAVSL